MYQQFLLHGQTLPQKLMPDYRQPLKYILCNAAKMAIEELRRLDPLLYVCHRNPEELEDRSLPTWVPKWHRKQDLGLDHFPLNYTNFRASQDSEPFVQRAGQDNWESLMVEGFVLDEVQGLTEPFSQHDVNIDDNLLALLRSVENLLAGASRASDGFELTLVASLDHRMSPVTQEQNARGYRALIKHLSSTNSTPSHHSDEDEAEIQAGSAYREALVRWTRNRRFFITEHGHVGTAPQVAQRGDLVSILYGSGVPIILRQVVQRESYAVIGQAYVFGHMSGEAVEKHKKAGSENMQFTLI